MTEPDRDRVPDTASMNGVHDGNWGWGNEEEQEPQYEILHQWNQVFVNAVRGTGGNNSGRFLAVTGYCAALRHTGKLYSEEAGRVIEAMIRAVK
jgi:hypothetical protein